MTPTEVLLGAIDHAYDHQSWHGTNLRGSVRGLTLAQVSRRPSAGRHNIWELVVHCAYWKYAVVRRLTGQKRGSFPLKGSNWFARPTGRPNDRTLRARKDAQKDAWRDTWTKDVALLDRMHRELRATVAALPASRLHAKAKGRKTTNRKTTNLWIIQGIAAHDLYHAGQIQLLKRITRAFALAAILVAAGPPAAFGQAARPSAAATRPPERFTVQSDGHAMAVWGRRPATPKGAILLVHGRTWSSRPDFDLQVPDLQRSVLTSFVAQGFAAYALDLRGYGETPRDATGWLTPRRSAQDIANVLDWVAAQHPSLPKPTLVGWSRGAIMAGMAAIAGPTRLSNVVLFGFAFDPDLTFADIGVPDKPAMEKNTAAAAASDFVSPKITPRMVVAAFVEQALRADPVLVDVKRDDEFNLFKPASLSTPTLVLYGSNDAGVVAADAGKMFAKIAAVDKQMVVLPGADHAAQLEDTHDAWIAAIVNFINRPGTKK